ncbi:hypothetical protein GCM10020295_10740 [Streptomyces cinereospinus]
MTADSPTLPRSLVVRLDSAGDVLLAGPAVRAVAAGSSYTALLCGPQGAGAARLLPGVDEVLVHDAPWTGLDPAPVSRRATRELLDTLTARRFDRALVLVSYHQSPLPAALLLKLAGVGWTAADSEDYPGALLDLRHHRQPHRHEVLAALDLARDAGFALPPGDNGALRVTPPPDMTRLTGPEPYVVLHPGAAVPARAWSRERAVRAAAALAAAGYRVVVTGGGGTGADGPGGRGTRPGPGRCHPSGATGRRARRGAGRGGRQHRAGASGRRRRHSGGVPVRAGGTGRALAAVRRPACAAGGPGGALRGHQGPDLPHAGPSLPRRDRGRGGAGRRDRALRQPAGWDE